MEEPAVRRKKLKAVDGKTSSKKNDKDRESSKRSESPKKHRESSRRSASPKKDKKVTLVEEPSRSESASADFEAGVIFSRLVCILPFPHSPPSCSYFHYQSRNNHPNFYRFDKAQRGVLSADAFRQIWREGKFRSCSRQEASTIRTTHAPADSLRDRPSSNAAYSSFDARRIFSELDANGEERIDKKDFENLLRDHPELLKPNYNGESSSTYEVNQLLPTEVVTGRLLTHYDETAGVALPQSAVDQHKKLGNTVMPLPESYRSRYDRLRSLLTGRLLPRREYLLQLRRQLQNCSTEVEAARKAIERETLADSEQILERLRSAEAMRQSSIKHQVRSTSHNTCKYRFVIEH